MPVPIKPNSDYSRDKTSSGVDYSMLFNMTPKKKTVTASNNDASILFDLWTKCERSNTPDELKISSSMQINPKDIMRLKALGFIQGSGDQVQFTKKGKIVITTMSLGEESQFDKKRQDKSYTEILASMSKKNKQGYRIPKFASDNNNHLDLRDS